MGRKRNTNGRREDLIFGISPVIEALRAKRRRIEKVLIAEGRQHKRVEEIIGLARARNIRFQIVARRAISNELAPGDNHQGVVAFGSAADYYDEQQLLKELAEKDGSLCVILDGVEDPHNLGAVIRTAECAGADGIFIPARRAAGLNETVAKTSAGAVEFVKVAKVVNINRLIDNLKRSNIWVVGASATAEKHYTEWDFTQRTALVLGGEGAGLHRLTEEKADELVKIPLSGMIDSLNVSVTAGVLLFEARRQKGLKRS